MMLHHLSGGAWGLVIRRVARGGARTLPLLALLVRCRSSSASHDALPVGRPEVVAADHAARSTRRRTSTCRSSSAAASSTSRSGSALAWLLNRCRGAQDATGDPAPGRPHAARSRAPGSSCCCADRHVRLGRLADVARPALVLDDLRRRTSSAARRSSALAFVIVVASWLSRSASRCARVLAAAALPRLRQAAACLRDALGLPLVLAVPDHLVGQPAGGDRLVPARASHGGWQWRRARRSCSSTSSCPFLLLLSRDVKRNGRGARRGGRARARHALARPRLAGRAGAVARRGTFRRSTGSTSRRSVGDRRHLARRLPRASSASGRCCRSTTRASRRRSAMT